MLVPLLFASAMAATPEDIAHGWYLAESGRLEQAAQLAAQALSENSHDLQAHRLYVWSLDQGLQDSAALEQQYRAWQRAEPDNDYARVALAGLLAGLNQEQGAWCDEVEALLAPMPKDTGVKYWAHRYRYTARGICPAEQSEDRQALLELATVTPSALGFSLRLRMAEGRVDEALATDLQTFYTLEPWNMAFPGNLWGDQVKGPGLKVARAAALDAARAALEADSPAYAQGAFRIFAQAGNDAGRVAAETRRAELDPAWSTLDRDWNGERLSLTEGGRSGLERALERARHKASIEAAQVSLEALEPAIPSHGPLRSIYLREQAYIQYRAHDEAAAFASFEAAWQEDPNNASAANGFAYLAALRGEKLDLALVVMDSILEQTPNYDPWVRHSGTSYEAWATRQSDQVAARLDTRAWILHQIDRTEEAASVMQRALLLIGEPDPILYHHLGFILLELGERDGAFEAFGRGLALGPSTEEELDVLAREAAEGLFAERRWAPGGLDGWVAVHTPPRKAPASRAGEVLPDLALVVDDKPRALSDFEGVRVVVFWSARSTPFTDSISSWTQLSKRYHKDPVQFLGLCVDQRPENTTEFWQGYRLPPMLLGWVGPGGAALAGVDSTPVALVIDGDGVIRGQIAGQLSPDDGRLQDWIDALLAEAWAEAEAEE
jgi:tetratricopeptide (TPR) repeat protein